MQTFTMFVKKALKHILKKKDMSIIYQSEEKPQGHMCIQRQGSGADRKGQDE